VTVRGLLEALDRIKVLLVGHRDASPDLVLEQMGGLSARIFARLNLDRFLPDREGASTGTPA
jgi:hypothetical protein